MTRLFLLNVPLLMLLSGCSLIRPQVPMPPPPANLAQSCPQIPGPPRPLVDPDRAAWEADVIAIYADCAARHWWTVDAWKNAVKDVK